MKTILKLTLIAALLLSFTHVDAAETLNGAGATFPYPVYSAWAYDYNKITGVQLNYQSIGSGGGVRQITERTVDFGASDAPMTPEADFRRTIYCSFLLSLEGLSRLSISRRLSRDSSSLILILFARFILATLNIGTMSKIMNMNQGLKLSHSEITVVYRSDGSGTTAIFTDYLNGICPVWKEKVGAGKAVKFPVGIGGKGNEGVANYVQRTANSIGYVEFAYAKQNKLNHAQLKNAAGNFIEPSFESFEDAAETGDFDANKGFYLWLTNAPGKGSWPIAGATFILLAKEKTDVNKSIVKFFDWAFKNGDAKAKELVYVPLPKSLKDKIRTYWKDKGIY